jgi:hypothetical protein
VFANDDREPGGIRTKSLLETSDAGMSTTRPEVVPIDPLDLQSRHDFRVEKIAGARHARRLGALPVRGRATVAADQRTADD